MDKVIALLKNKWFKFGVSFLSLGFPLLILYVDWLSFAYYFEQQNSIPLFLLYVLVNFVFGGIMLYTRRQIITQIVACITPIAAFVMLILAFGEWYMIIPPVVICLLTFLAAGTNETFKTILGTIYLLMFVVGTLVYLTLLHFNLTVQSLLSLTECDMTKRSEKYIYSPDKAYRVVKYIDTSNSERTVASYYIEKTEDDVELPYLKCFKHLGSQKLLVTMDPDSVKCSWVSDTELFIDGRIKNIPEIFKKAENAGEEEEDNPEDYLTYYEIHSNSISDARPVQTAAAETVPAEPTEEPSDETPEENAE